MTRILRNEASGVAVIAHSSGSKFELYLLDASLVPCRLIQRLPAEKTGKIVLGDEWKDCFGR